VVKCFDTSTPGIQNYLLLSGFWRFTFCDSGTPVVKCFDTSTPGIQNCLLFHFRDFGIWWCFTFHDSGTPIFCGEDLFRECP
jgi:hypothetical protein